MRDGPRTSYCGAEGAARDVAARRTLTPVVVSYEAPLSPR